MTGVLHQKDAALLLQYAENMLAYTVIGGNAPHLPEVPMLDGTYGAFCTLQHDGALRGCIGSFAGAEQLRDVLPRIIRESALEDRRFPPVTPPELEKIEVTLSILFPARPVDSVLAVEPGRDGVILSAAGRRAVFLPEVALEQGWDRATLMDALCRKAKLPVGAWRRNGADIEVFQTLRISRDAVDARRVLVGGTST